MGTGEATHFLSSGTLWHGGEKKRRAGRQKRELIFINPQMLAGMIPMRDKGGATL